MKAASLLTLALAVLVGLVLAAPGKAHVNAKAPIIHEIDHLRRDTNALRKEAGRKPIATDFVYRKIESRELRLEVRDLWRKRFAKALERSVWHRLAQCEANGNWRFDGQFDGGLQFHPGTWETYRIDGYPEYAHEATPAEQIRVARRVLAAEGWRAWPACSAILGLR